MRSCVKAQCHGPTPGPVSPRGTELLGYLEDWVDVSWWDNNMPGNCLMGCFKPEPYLKALAPYSAVNYGFLVLTTDMNPDQIDCHIDKDGHKVPLGCPLWGGHKIYMAQASKQGSTVVDDSTTITSMAPGIVTISEAMRMARMHPQGPKRMKVTLGGWSDFARLGNAQNGEAAAVLMAKVVKVTFADGVDVDMEHFAAYNNKTDFPQDDEFGAFAAFITKLRSELDQVAADWVASANARKAALQSAYDKLEPWQKKQAAPYYTSNINYLGEVAKNGPPKKLDISWTTRFNAFIPKDDPWNYLKPNCPRPKERYASDNEGTYIYPRVGQYIDTVNIMAYDAGNLTFNFPQILDNFVKLGQVPASKINMGFEPGEQNAGGKWEGQEVDEQVARYVKQNQFGGCMIWAANPSCTQTPVGCKACPATATSLNTILEPTYAWGPAPTYTKCDPSSGWWPGLAAVEPETTKEVEPAIEGSPFMFRSA